MGLAQMTSYIDPKTQENGNYAQLWEAMRADTPTDRPNNGGDKVVRLSRFIQNKSTSGYYKTPELKSMLQTSARKQSSTAKKFESPFRKKMQAFCERSIPTFKSPLKGV